MANVENFLADDTNRDIRYLVIATRNRLPSSHVQLAPYAVTEIDWLDHRHQAERHPRSGEIAPRDRNTASKKPALGANTGRTLIEAIDAARSIVRNRA
jgi:hypothetical protein